MLSAFVAVSLNDLLLDVIKFRVPPNDERKHFVIKDLRMLVGLEIFDLPV